MKDRFRAVRKKNTIKFCKLLTFWKRDKNRITHCIQIYAALDKKLLVYQYGIYQLWTLVKYILVKKDILIAPFALWPPHFSELGTYAACSRITTNWKKSDKFDKTGFFFPLINCNFAWETRILLLSFKIAPSLVSDWVDILINCFCQIVECKSVLNIFCSRHCGCKVSSSQTSDQSEINFFKVNSGNNRTMCVICSELTLKTSEWAHWRSSGVLTVFCLVLPLLTLIKYMPAEETSLSRT